MNSEEAHAGQHGPARKAAINRTGRLILSEQLVMTSSAASPPLRILSA
jgi:hypothetical protein